MEDPAGGRAVMEGVNLKGNILHTRKTIETLNA